MARRQRIAPNFNLGGEQAEADPLLEEAFYESSIFDAIAAKRDPRRLVSETRPQKAPTGESANGCYFVSVA